MEDLIEAAVIIMAIVTSILFGTWIYDAVRSVA